jgi:hypothetical protein
MMPFIIVIVAAVIGIGSVVYFKSDDNPVEEIAEEVIKNEIGKEVDLSPKSPEKK